MECPGCEREVRVTTAGKFYKHPDMAGLTGDCDWSGVDVNPTANDEPFTRPPNLRTVSDAIPMTELGAEVCARFKETFYSYVNRQEPDNRASQSHVGPSEVGTPCDRRLAMSLMRCVPVNPGGDGWPSFVGTCVHAGLAEMFMWAGKHTGRYAVELPLTFPSDVMPRGKGDLLDRTMCLFADHKLMGRWSLESLRTKGPSEMYRVQVHLYAWAARRAGETVDNVAIVGWPREGRNLDDLYVWAVNYDPRVATDAHARLERIAKQLPGDWRDFDTANDCLYCPHHGPSSCPGR
jgi:hypothetical protein